MGEIPTVQERFHAILKRRLQIQAQQNPPLFPWETQVLDYLDCVEEESLMLVPVWGWTVHQSKLNLPIPLPEKVFWQLLEKCQGLLTSSLPLGAKLVQVVDSMFPADPQTINDLAGLVLRSSYRSADSLAASNIDSDYFELLPRQQMVLSLMAAKQLLENLTLPVSRHQPVLERQWLTSVGTLNVQVQLRKLGKLLRLYVEGELPTMGIFKLHDHDAHIVVSEFSEMPSVELDVNEFQSSYCLSVEFPDLDQQPLLLAIQVQV
ncbi:PatU [Anabaena sp. FACHB-1237]|nr:PatU [Anabaena sp. FACHB-1237]